MLFNSSVNYTAKLGGKFHVRRFYRQFFPERGEIRPGTGRFAETAPSSNRRCAWEIAQQAVGLGELIGTADVDDLETGRADPHDFM